MCANLLNITALDIRRNSQRGGRKSKNVRSARQVGSERNAVGELEFGGVKITFNCGCGFGNQTNKRTRPADHRNAIQDWITKQFILVVQQRINIQSVHSVLERGKI